MGGVWFSVFGVASRGRESAGAVAGAVVGAGGNVIGGGDIGDVFGCWFVVVLRGVGGGTAP